MEPDRSHSFWERWADFSIRRSRLILVVVALVTLLFAYFLFRIEIYTDVGDFKRPETVRLIRTIEDQFNQGSYLVVIFVSPSDRSLLEPDLLHQQFHVIQEIKKRFKVKTYSLVEGINEGLERIKRKSLIDFNDYTPIAEGILALSGGLTVGDLEKVSRHMLSHPEAVAFYEKLRVAAHAIPSLGPGSSPLGQSKNLYEVPSVKAIRAYVQLDSSYSLREQRKILASIRQLTETLATSNLEIYLYSEDLVAQDIDVHASKNALLMGLLLVVIDTLLLWWVFRSRSEVALTLFILATSSIWSFGMMGLLKQPLSFLHLIALPILLGTGDDACVAFGGRFAEELGQRKKPLPALRASYLGTGTGIFLTTLTTFVGFLCDVPFTSRTISSFSLLVAYSMVVVFLLTILVQGAVRAEFFRHHFLIRSGPENKLHPFFGKLLQGFSSLGSRWIATRPRAILLWSGLVFLFGVIAILWGLDSEFDPKIFIRRTMPTYPAQKAQEKYFGHSDPGYVLIEGDVENPLVLQKLRLLEERMVQVPYLEKVLGKANTESVNELIDKKGITLNDDSSIRSVLDQITASRETANFVSNESYQEVARHLVHKTGQRYDGLLVKFFAEAEGKGERVVTLYRALEGEIQKLRFDQIPGLRVRVGGGTMSFHLDETYFFGNFIQSFFLSFALNFLVLIFAWRKVGKSFLAMVPVLLSVILTLGLMPLFGVKLNVLNLCIGAIVVGIGVDYPILIIERFDEERKKGAVSLLKAAQTTLNTIGPSILGGAATTILGFAASCILAMPVAESFGIFTALAITFVYIASIFLLPVLLVRFQRLENG